MTVRIEKNIPLPGNESPTGRTPKYPWHEMEIGDSFKIDRPTVSVSAVNDRMKPKRFISRKVDGGYRFWRVK